MLTLDKYQIDDHTGFLQRSRTVMPAILQPFKDALEKFEMCSDSKQLREDILKLPRIDGCSLKSHEELRLGHKIFSFLASRYVWHDGDEGVVETLPAVIARPLMDISMELGCQPLLGHVDLVLSNCFPINPLPDSETKRKYFIEFFPSNEVNWIPFIERTADIEISFTVAPKIIIEAFNSMQILDTKTLVDCLERLSKMLENMQHQIECLLDELDPRAFYCEMRRYLSGWSHGKLKNGLIYEGVPDHILTGQECNGLQGDSSPHGRIYQGASAGQSIVLQALDAFFQIEHLPEINKFFVEIRQYMIKEHRQFIEDVIRQTRLRDYVTESGNQLLKLKYNECISKLANFRKSHLVIVGRFILDPARKYATNVESLKNQGTGGQALSQFLDKILFKTEAAAVIWD